MNLSIRDKKPEENNRINWKPEKKTKAVWDKKGSRSGEIRRQPSKSS